MILLLIYACILLLLSSEKYNPKPETNINMSTPANPYCAIKPKGFIVMNVK